MSDYIPDHILSSVLLRLPFGSLIRFRCVSKSWRDLIDSSPFVGMHSRRSRLTSQANPHPDSKIIAMVERKFYAFDSMAKDGKGSCKAIAKELIPPAMEYDVQHKLDFVGSCHGIICLWEYWNDCLVLWNPFTQSSTELPSPPYEFTMDYRCNIETAFVYDQINDDFKVVRWYVCAAPAVHVDTRGSGLYELCVYSLKLNSWRTIRDAITFELPEDYEYFPEDSAFVNGALHWLVVTDFSRRPVDCFIVAFDVGTYEFRKVPCSTFPVKSSNMNHYMMKLGSLNGCLSLVCYTYFRTSRERRGAEIWLMEDYGVESSWTKLTWMDRYRLKSFVWEFKPVAFTKKQGKLLLQSRFSKLAIYDLKSKSYRDVAIEGEVNCSISCVCVGSFVSTCSQGNWPTTYGN